MSQPPDDTPRGTVALVSKRQGLLALRALRSVEGDDLRFAITVDDSNDERSVLSALRDFAAEAGIKVIVATSPSHAQQLSRDARPQRCFVSGWYWLIEPACLKAVPGGFVGVHNSLLPAYRGGAPVVWGLINGERRVGASIFYMGEGMDDGRVLEQLPVDVGPDDHVGDVLSRIEDRVQAELPGIWRGVVDGSIEAWEQDHERATYCGQRRPEDGRIDWSWSARRIHDFVRAQTPPYPGAFTTCRGESVHVLQTSVFAGTYHCTPGQVLLRTNEGTLVGCGNDTALRVERVRVDGEEGPARDILKSVRTRLRG